MFKPAIVSNRNDWFEVDSVSVQDLWGADFCVPGVKRKIQSPPKPDTFLIHRSHLPLMGHPEAIKICTEREAGDWAARDRETEARGFKLRITQQQALDYFKPRRGILLGDDMRTGKTLASMMAHDPKRGPLVIVAPLSTRAVWFGWLKRVFPDLPIAKCIGRKIDPALLKYPIVFIHYDLIKDWQVLMPIGTLIFDEGQAIMNSKTLRSKAAAILASRAEKVIVATGTPIWDRPKDLWNIVSMLAPAAWGSYYDFGNRYGAPVQTAYGVDFPGISNADELRLRLSEVMIRRLWKDVQSDLPATTRNIVVAEVDDVTRRKLDVLAGKLKSERTNTAGNLATYRRQLCSVKLRAVLERAKKDLAGGDPLVIWTWHKDFADEITQAFDGQARMITGDIPPVKRDAIMDAWRQTANGVLVSTMPVAQVGIDLSHAPNAIFAELDYVPAIIAQAEMRTYDPKRPMNITFVVADHVVDQRIMKSLIAKLGASDPIGLGSAVDAIEAIRDALLGPNEEGDMARFLDDLLASEVG